MPDLDDLAAIRSVSDVRVAPGGGRIAFVVTTPGETPSSSIWIDDRAVTEGPEDRAPRWLPDGSLAFLRGDEIRVLPIDGGESRLRVKVDTGVREHAWSPDGTLVAYTTTAVTPEPSAPIVIDRLFHKLDGTGRLTGTAVDVFVHDGTDTARRTDAGTLLSSVTWTDDGRHLLVAAATHDDRDLDGSSDLWVLPARGDEIATLERLTSWSGAVGAPVLDGDRLLFVGVHDASPLVQHTVFSVPVAGGKPEDVLPDLDRNVLTGGPGYPGAPISLDGRGGLIAAIREHGTAPLVRIDLATGEVRTLVDGVVTAASVDVESGTVAAVRITETQPEEVVVTSVDGGEVRQVTALHDELARGWRQHPNEERWFTAPDGLLLQGWLRRRADASGPQPLLVDIHGGPHNAWMPAFDSAHLYHHVLADRGWAVLTLNPRASDGYGQAFWAGAGGDWGNADEGDFLAAVDALVDEGIADPSKLAVAGYSYGGFMTTWLVGRTDRFAAAVAGGVVVDAHSMHGVSDVGALSIWREWGARPWEQPAVYTSRSPITRVGAVSTPTLLLHGEADTRCPVGEAERFFAALRARGVESQLVLYPGEPHVYPVTGSLEHRRDHQQRTVDWLVRHVEGTTDGA